MALLARINVHPVKSLDPQAVERAVLLASGALEHDRRFALCDREGHFVNAKRTPAVHLLRSAFDPATNQLRLRAEDMGEVQTFDVVAERSELSRFLGDFLATPLEFVENPLAGFPDDVESPGPTVISTATLTEVASWFPGLSVNEVRRRFRANLEIDGVEPFWEDRLVAEGTGVVRFRIGAAELLGTNPCQRCPVPSRNSYTGEPIREFAKIFSSRRQQSLPAWAPSSRFDHFYRLAVNTRAAYGKSCTLRVGDDVQVLGVP
jgi:uncharacterized protein